MPPTVNVIAVAAVLERVSVAAVVDDASPPNVNALAPTVELKSSEPEPLWMNVELATANRFSSSSVPESSVVAPV